MWLLHLLAHSLTTAIPSLRWLSLPAEVSLFSAMMHEQLDLRQESRHLHRFRQNFEATGKAWGMGPVVRFPRPIMARRACLVEELVSDTSIPIDSVMQYCNGKAPVRERV